MKEIFQGIFQIGNELATKNLSGQGFDERLIKEKNMEFRVFDPTRSKLAAAIRNGLKNLPIKKSMKILYLGAANGYTCSYLSDAIEDGIIYAVEFSPRAVRDLIRVSKSRKNIIPILEDARLPENYANRVEKVDLVYCDLAQRDQAQILIRNADVFLKKAGYMMIAIKARSIDVTKKPSFIYAQQRAILEKTFKIMQQIDLRPFERDHAFFVGQMR